MTYRYYPHSDHFDIDHQDYYNNFLDVFKYGSSREGKRKYVFSKKDNYREVTQNIVDHNYIKLISTLKKIDFIRILKSNNARIEFIDQFSDNFTWNSMIQNADFDIDNFFDVQIRFECKDFTRLGELVRYIPQSVTKHFNLNKNYIVLPYDGLDDEEDIYTINIKIHSGMIKSKLQFRKYLNQYLLEINQCLEVYLQEKSRLR